jgi:valyl-tRNA synthetase
VTEEIYAHIPGTDGLLAQRRSTPAPEAIDADAEAATDRTILAVQAIRVWRDAADVKPAAILPARLVANGYKETLEPLARLGRLQIETDMAASPAGEAAGTITVPGGAIEILPTADVDLRAAQDKRERKRVELDAEIKRAEGKLANQAFVAKAPPVVVTAERAKLAALKEELEAL